MYAEIKELRSDIVNLRKAINYLAKVIDTQNQMLKEIATKVAVLENRELRKARALEDLESTFKTLKRITKRLDYQTQYGNNADLVMALEQELEELQRLYKQNYDPTIRKQIVYIQEQILQMEGYDVKPQYHDI